MKTTYLLILFLILLELINSSAQGGSSINTGFAK